MPVQLGLSPQFPNKIEEDYSRADDRAGCGQVLPVIPRKLHQPLPGVGWFAVNCPKAWPSVHPPNMTFKEHLWTWRE